MKKTQAVLSVKFKSSFREVCLEDLDAFRNVLGLIQKYYLSEDASGAISGLYIFESKADRTLFWSSDLAGSIPARYSVIPESLRVEEFEMLIVLKDEVLA